VTSKVRAGQHGGLIDQNQGARGDADRAAGAAAAGQVTQEPGRVIGHRHPGGREGVAGGLGRVMPVTGPSPAATSRALAHPHDR